MGSIPIINTLSIINLIPIMTSIIIYSFIPEMFLALSLLIHLIFNISLLNSNSLKYRVLTLESLFQTIFILSITALLISNTAIEGFFINYLFSFSLGSNYIKFLSILISLFIIVIVYQNFKDQALSFYEYFTLYLIINLALLLLISSTDMLSAYLAIELQTLSFYILASFLRQSCFSSEAGLKYFILGSVFSGCFLFGCSIFYGLFGTLNFNYLSLLLIDFNSISYFKSINFLIVFGLILIISTFLFKLGVAPFHFWVPDVYDGIPISSLIIFSILPKVATVYFFIKWLTVLNNTFSSLNFILMLCGLLSLIIGSFFALIQNRLKKLIIYSSIAQMGYVIIGVSQITLNSITGVIFFLMTYLITLIAFWNLITLFFSFNNRLAKFNKMSLNGFYISSLQNLNSQHFVLSIILSFLFFSIAGIPPFSGFLAKVLILQSLLETHLYAIVSLIVLISLLTLFYYLRLIKILFFEPIISKHKKNSALTLINSDKLLLNSHCSIFFVFLLVFSFFQPNIFLFIANIIAVSV